MALEKLAVFGGGAIGSMIGAYLTRAGHDITLIDLWPAHVEMMKQVGLRLTSQDEDFTAKPKALHLVELCRLRTQFDAVFLAVKSYDSVWAATCISSHLTPTGILVSTQNSINEEWLAPVIGYTRLLGCVVLPGASLDGPGHVRRFGSSLEPSFIGGELHGLVTRRLSELVDMLSAAGPARITTNLWGERWAKLIANCMANGLAGITGLSNVELRGHAQVFPMTVRIAAEALAVAHTLGVQVEPIGGVPAQAYLDAASGDGRETLRATWVERGRSIGSGRLSLLQDVIKGRRTEVEYLNGYVVRKGREVALSTPMNEAIVELTKRVEAGALIPSSANLELLRAYL
jgi:2-dehydropantoate 2-reductase